MHDQTEQQAQPREPDPRTAMGEESLVAIRLLALFIIGCLLFGYPILALFSRTTTVLGVPLLFAYLFAAWAAFIAILAGLVEGERRR